MLKQVQCEDPRFLEWQGIKRSDPKNMNIACYPYAVADDATVAEYAARPSGKLWRTPTIGDGWGINVKLSGIVTHMTAQTVCEYAEKDGLRRLKDPEITDPLPVASPGHRLVAILYGERNGEFEYHTLREHNGLWSHKFGNSELPSIYDARKQVITDPRQARFYEMQQGPFFFEVPMGGVDLRVSTEMGDILDNIQSQHIRFSEQVEKRRKLNLRCPELARDFRQLSRMTQEKDPFLSKQFALMSELHTTGKPPAGVHMRTGLFRRTI